MLYHRSLSLATFNTTNLKHLQVHSIHPRRRVSAGHRFSSMDKLAMHVISITSAGTGSTGFCGVLIFGNELDEIMQDSFLIKTFLFDIFKESSVGV